jgi:Rhodanese-like domain
MVATGDTPLGMVRKWRIPMREASTNACAAAAHAGGAVMIDVREPYEYLAGHVPGAQSVPMTAWRRSARHCRAPNPSTSPVPPGDRSRAAADFLALGSRLSDTPRRVARGWVRRDVGFGRVGTIGPGRMQTAAVASMVVT